MVVVPLGVTTCPELWTRSKQKRLMAVLCVFLLPEHVIDRICHSIFMTGCWRQLPKVCLFSTWRAYICHTRAFEWPRVGDSQAQLCRLVDMMQLMQESVHVRTKGYQISSGSLPNHSRGVHTQKLPLAEQQAHLPRAGRCKRHSIYLNASGRLS